MFLRFAVLILLLDAACASGDVAQIQVDASRVTNSISRYMTGACLEDVNHEVYGGIYSQMIFGESFQEPQGWPQIEGFQSYGAGWSVEGGELACAEVEETKIVSDRPPLRSGEAGVQIMIVQKHGGVPSLLVKVGHANTGVDNFTAYEIGLMDNKVLVARHHQNFSLLTTFPCQTPLNQWISLTVTMKENSLAVSVNGKEIGRYTDDKHPLQFGTIGLRTFHQAARFRNLWFKSDTDAQKVDLPFKPAPLFEGVSGPWRGFSSGSARPTFELIHDRPFVGQQSQRITLSGGQGRVGIENQGLNGWGLNFVGQKIYEGRVWVRAPKPIQFHVQAQSREGTKVLADAPLAASRADWQPVDFALTPNDTDHAGRFLIELQTPGTLDIGYVFLQPGEWGRFKKLPVRKDVAEALIEQGITVLRYGGSMVNADEYRWKKMTGPRDRRPPYKGFWYSQSSNGWGIIDFLDFCEATGFLGVPAFNVNESAQDMADFIEYVNGPADSTWGARRVADGHPQPYHLKYLEIGNEEHVDQPYYWQHFDPTARAIWKVDRGVIPVVGDFYYDKPITDPLHVQGAAVKTLAVHRQILQFAQKEGTQVWFDVHVNTPRPRDPPNVDAVASFSDALKKLAPGAKFKVVIFELNADNHDLARALGNAHAINAFQRLGDRVAIVCSANCLQPDGQNDNGWDQGLLFLNPSSVWAQPPYFVTQMFSRNYQPQSVQVRVTSPRDALDVTATKSVDGKILVLSVVNMDAAEVDTKVEVSGFNIDPTQIRAAQLAGALDQTNTASEPRHVSPREVAGVTAAGGTIRYTFPSNSFTILRLESKP